MSILRPRSLRWRLISRIAFAQTVLLVMVMFGLSIAISVLWYFGYINQGAYEGTTAEAVKNAVMRAPNGSIFIQDTESLRDLRAHNPDVWFIVRDREGHQVTFGTLPRQVLPIVPALDTVASADLLRDPTRDELPFATVQWLETPAGWIKILSGTEGMVSLRTLIAANKPSLIILAVLTAILALSTLVATPFVIRRAFKGLDKASAEAKGINFERSGSRLSIQEIPLEVSPFVSAVNDALERLDRGYEVHRRFLIEAAHELRTPIAIITTRIEGLPEGPLKNRILEDANRLTCLAGQLLDLQRLNHHNFEFVELDLVAIAERVVFDLAPMAFKAGYEMNFEADAISSIVKGDVTAIERAVTNLIQNAIDHGGRKGCITIRVSGEGYIEVIDQGVGIPEAEQEHVFEAFHRLIRSGQGVGLGLALVKSIMVLHGGNAEVFSGRHQGARFRLTFPTHHHRGT